MQLLPFLCPLCRVALLRRTRAPKGVAELSFLCIFWGLIYNITVPGIFTCIISLELDINTLSCRSLLDQDKRRTGSERQRNPTKVIAPSRRDSSPRLSGLRAHILSSEPHGNAHSLPSHKDNFHPFPPETKPTQESRTGREKLVTSAEPLEPPYLGHLVGFLSLVTESYQSEKGGRTGLWLPTWLEVDPEMGFLETQQVPSKVMQLVSGRANIWTRSDSKSKLCPVPPQCMDFLKVLNLFLWNKSTSQHLSLSYSSFLAVMILKDTVPFISKAPTIWG